MFDTKPFFSFEKDNLIYYKAVSKGQQNYILQRDFETSINASAPKNIVDISLVISKLTKKKQSAIPKKELWVRKYNQNSNIRMPKISPKVQSSPRASR